VTAAKASTRWEPADSRQKVLSGVHRQVVDRACRWALSSFPRLICFAACPPCSGRSASSRLCATPTRTAASSDVDSLILNRDPLYTVTFRDRFRARATDASLLRAVVLVAICEVGQSRVFRAHRATRRRASSGHRAIVLSITVTGNDPIRVWAMRSSHPRPRSSDEAPSDAVSASGASSSSTTVRRRSPFAEFSHRTSMRRRPRLGRLTQLLRGVIVSSAEKWDITRPAHHSTLRRSGGRVLELTSPHARRITHACILFGMPSWEEAI
jgi:hypothetical protein